MVPICLATKSHNMTIICKHRIQRGNDCSAAWIKEFDNVATDTFSGCQVTQAGLAEASANPLNGLAVLFLNTFLGALIFRPPLPLSFDILLSDASALGHFGDLL